MRAIDVTEGYKFGRWTILSTEFVRVPTGGAWFPARCSCGTVRAILFKGGFQSQSCGCLQKEVASANRTHGESRTRLYKIWTGMKQRCQNPKKGEYYNYGGRGIFVVPEWEDYIVFRDWALANGYTAELQIDRMENDGPYSPDNCQWVTGEHNLRNTRRNVMLTAFGETKCLIDWAEDSRCVLEPKSFMTRIRLGWDTEDALVTPKNNWNPARRRSPVREGR